MSTQDIIAPPDLAESLGLALSDTLTSNMDAGVLNDHPEQESTGSQPQLASDQTLQPEIEQPEGLQPEPHQPQPSQPEVDQHLHPEIIQQPEVDQPLQPGSNQNMQNLVESLVQMRLQDAMRDWKMIEVQHINNNINSRKRIDELMAEIAAIRHGHDNLQPRKRRRQPSVVTHTDQGSSRTRAQGRLASSQNQSTSEVIQQSQPINVEDMVVDESAQSERPQSQYLPSIPLNQTTVFPIGEPAVAGARTRAQRRRASQGSDASFNANLITAVQDVPVATPAIRENRLRLATQPVTLESGRAVEPPARTATRPRRRNGVGSPPSIPDVQGPDDHEATPRRTAFQGPITRSRSRIEAASLASTVGQTGISPIDRASRVPQQPTSLTHNDPFRYLPGNYPDDIQGIKNAIFLHIRILWGLTSSTHIPQVPPAYMLENFCARFSTESQVLSSHDSGPELVSLRLIQIGNKFSSTRGKLARQVRYVEEHILEYTQVRLSRLGLISWCPDLRQTPYSLYNSACRIVALDTFKQALVSRAYDHLRPRHSYATNLDLLTKLYDHFVHSYMYARYTREAQNPGVMETELRNNPQYQKRIRLSRARIDFLKENGYPQRYIDLIHPKITSDDEEDPIRKVFIIKRRPERSSKAEMFIRILDAKRKQSAIHNNRKWRERVRIVPPEDTQQYSEFTGIPDSIPIDYFDVGYFNNLQPAVRFRIAQAQIAFLPNINESFGIHPNERLRDLTFHRKYGRAVMEQYNLVTHAEITRLNEGVDEEAEQLGDDEGEGDWVDQGEQRSDDNMGSESDDSFIDDDEPINGESINNSFNTSFEGEEIMNNGDFSSSSTLDAV